ncbi:YbaB/EbfC family nucleoid-associated protein [Pseudonocardia sp.]|uniref:YbaB/EbfC family nucleoid-associated protein n=1 Tax=Pseudonocardia sp. TaxID=60912 RepID=UPI003D134145
MDAQVWLDGYQRRIDEAGRRAREVQERLGAVEASVTSPDGAVTATVVPGGVLRDLVLHEAAERLSRIQLAETITETAAAAHAAAGRAVADAVAPLLGPEATSFAAFAAGNPR